MWHLKALDFSLFILPNRKLQYRNKTSCQVVYADIIQLTNEFIYIYIFDSEYCTLLTSKYIYKCYIILYKSWIILFLIVITNNNYNYYTLDTSLHPLHHRGGQGYQPYKIMLDSMTPCSDVTLDTRKYMLYYH